MNKNYQTSLERKKFLSFPFFLLLFIAPKLYIDK